MAKLFLVLVPILVLFGAINTIQLKLQNIQVISEKGKFFHPFMQTILMFVGQTLVGIVYLIQKSRNKKQETSIYSQKKPASALIVLFPAVMDLLSTLLSYIALNMVDSSVWQISRGGNIIFTALLSRIFLKRIFSGTSIFGCVLAFLGITSVQVVAVIYSDSSSSTALTEEVIGILLLLASIIFNSIGLVYEKWIFNKYELSALKLVFLEGLYGLIVMIPLTFAFQYVHCPWNESNCVNVDGELYLQNFKGYWQDIQSNLFLLLLNLGLIISIAVSVPIAVTVSKKISPVSRSLADVCRTVIIWLFGIIMTLTYGQDHPQYQIQNTTVVVNILKAIGFVVLILGTMMYHELIPICAKKEENQLNGTLDCHIIYWNTAMTIIEMISAKKPQLLHIYHLFTKIGRLLQIKTSIISMKQLRLSEII